MSKINYSETHILNVGGWVRQNTSVVGSYVTFPLFALYTM